MVNLLINNSKKCNGEYSIFASFEYNADLVNYFKSFPTRYYDIETKSWELPLNKLGEVVNELQDYEINITGKYVDMTPKSVELPSTFTFKTTPYEYQKEGVMYGLSHDNFLLGDSMGLGKTKQAIDLAVIKKQTNNVKHCLVVVCVNSVCLNWKHEVEVHSNESAYVLGQRFRKRSNKMYIGSTADKLEDLKNIKDINDYFIVTNIETLRDKDVAEELKKLCSKDVIGMCLVDEMHKASNTQSQQGKGLLKVNPKYKIAMTGTPLMNKPLDLFGILKWLGYEKHTLNAFKNHHCVFGGYGNYQIVGYKNLDELQETLDTMMIRRLKEDVLDLPDKVFVDEYLEMNTKQTKIYKQCLEEVQSDIDKVKKAVNPLSELIRLRQATAHTSILSSTVSESVKFERCADIVEECKSNNESVVVFSQWTCVTDLLVPYLEKLGYKVACITGATNSTNRQNIVDNFQKGNYDVLVGTIGAAGTGLTLTHAHTMIFLDQPWTYANYSQACDRIYRIGQKNNVTIYNFICRDTIDETIWQTVKKKGKMSDMMLDENIEKEAITNLINSLL